MTQEGRLSLPIVCLGCAAILSGIVSPSLSVTSNNLSKESLQAIEMVHRQNIDQLHALHHAMRATFKQLSSSPSESAALQQFRAQLKAVSQTLDTVAATEKDHPQWAGSWTQRHARLVGLIQEMEGLLVKSDRNPAGPGRLDKLTEKLNEMKAILDIW